MKSTCFVFLLQIWILNNLSSVDVQPEKPLLTPRVNEAGNLELESTTKRPNPIGIGLDRPASDGHSSGATHSLSINLDGKQALRSAQTEHEGANYFTSKRTESIVNLSSPLVESIYGGSQPKNKADWATQSILDGDI